LSDFFDSDFGRARQTSIRSPRAWFKDALYDLALASSARLRDIRRSAAPVQKVLIAGVEVPGRAARLADITRRMANSRHTVDISTVRMRPQGKFANVDEAIAAAPHPLSHYDWLVITDDDVALPANFLDDYLALASEADLSVSQPAHRFASFASYQITRRVFGSLVRSTRFVEIGPITVLRANTFKDLVPFPPSRWCYGIDLVWSETARRRGWRMGVVDGTAIRHLNPVARSYDSSPAFAEGREMLARLGVTLSRAEVLRSEDLLRA
jgi:hypothetical protein